jgi:hypothetical protein
VCHECTVRRCMVHGVPRCHLSVCLSVLCRMSSAFPSVCLSTASLLVCVAVCLSLGLPFCRIDSALTVPSQCPHSALTVPSQFPHVNPYEITRLQDRAKRTPRGVGG